MLSFKTGGLSRDLCKTNTDELRYFKWSNKILHWNVYKVRFHCISLVSHHQKQTVD